MKIKTSITLSPEAIDAIDEIAGVGTSHSRVIEEAVIEFVASHRRRQREAKDLEILNRSAERLNRETEEVLRYQAEL
jgi:predicted transcriptional regulator